MLDWRIKTPSIAGPMESVAIPWVAVWSIASIAGVIFLVTWTVRDELTAVGLSFGIASLLWALASVRTRQDRDWLDIILERLSCKVRMMALYLWNKYHWGWPV